MSELCITGTGAVSAVGLTAAQTAASVRAGISRFSDHPIYFPLVDPEFPAEPEPLSCCTVSFLDALDAAPDRILNMLLAALEEPFVQAGLPRAELAEAGLFLAAPARREGTPEWGIERHLVSELVRRAAIPPFRRVELERRGATGFFHLLAAARQALADGECRYALLGGVDSWLDEATVKHFDAGFRLKSARNVDGFVPGEAATWLVLERRETAESRGAEVLARVHSPALASEPQPLLGRTHSTARGLGQALRQALGQSGIQPRWVICDMNGESYRAYEWGLIRARMAASFEKLEALWHPADCFGDIGAASPAMYAALACQAFRRGYAPAADCLIFAADDAGERGACVVSGRA